MSELGSLVPLACVFGGYLFGSISFAVLVSRLMGLSDPRSYGSGNPGATNVLRSGSKLAALLTLLGDAGKGALAAWLVLRWGGPWGAGADTAAWTGLAAFLGHLFPLYHRFQGGKGVATYLGVVWVIAPLLGAAICLLWLGVAAVTRYSSAASMASAAAAPLGWLVLGGADATFMALVLMTALLLWRHRGNIAKLRAGTERRIGEKAPSRDPGPA